MAEENVFERLLALAEAGGGADGSCACARHELAGWTRVPNDFPQVQMREVLNLRDALDPEPSYREYHPAGTHYWSTEAPIAPAWFPFNRCTVEQCGVCARAWLRYSEGGGYYLEARIRALDRALLVDAAPPDQRTEVDAYSPNM